ncbi:MAG: hypothetical protein KatS3mg102_2408 [Planctomycetota bacterium]|nr:MAG: hypothetical protein KatS3mg102_2408 [Planctomycetota bacterium]
MVLEFRLPDIGEGTVEGEVVRWLVEEGQAVAADQPVVEVMTDKATVELTAPRAGVLLEKRAQPGEVVPVGEVLYVLAEQGEPAPAPAGAKAQEQAGAPRTASPPPAAPSPPRPAAAAARAEAAVPGTPAAAPAEPPPAPAGSAGAAAVERQGDGRKPLATPATRKLAREQGIDLRQVRGSGPAGRITKEDVLRAAQALVAAPAAPAAAAPLAGEEPIERVPFRGLRRAIAKQMRRSKDTAAHFTYVEEVDMSEIVALRSEEKERLAAQGIKLTYLPFVIKAAIAGLKKYPLLNAELDEQAGEILLKKYYHIGISIDAEAGLSVGVIRHADRRSIAELALEIERLVKAVREGRATREDLTGSTFTITSAGNIGGVLATPIINVPEVAILGVNAIRKRPVVIEGPDGQDTIAIRHRMYLSISLDHRVVDGAVAARFMNEVVRHLEKPARLLIGA